MQITNVIKSDFRSLIYLDDVLLPDDVYLFLLTKVVLNKYLLPQFDDNSPTKHLHERMVPLYPPCVKC
jgi:hypothetical protein